jgi:hypothetical protein
MYDQRREALKDMASLGVDFVPVVGDIKGFAEAESAIDYLAAIIAIMPGGELVGKSLKAAEKALAKGDLESASRLINKASDDIQVKWVDENAGMSQRARIITTLRQVLGQILTPKKVKLPPLIELMLMEIASRFDSMEWMTMS